MRVGSLHISRNINGLWQKVANVMLATTALQLAIMWLVVQSSPISLITTAEIPSLTRYIAQPDLKYSGHSNELLTFILDQFNGKLSSEVGDLPQTIELASSNLSPAKNLKIFQREKTVTGTISGSFSETASNMNIPASVVDDFVDLIGDKINFNRDIQPGDTFSMMYTQKEDSNGKIIHVGSLKAASLMNNKKLLASIRYVDTNGRVTIYDENGKTAGNHFLRYPVQFTRVSSVFSDSRLHPVLHTKRPHNGVDFAAPIGAPVRTVADGTVERSGYYGGAGNMIKITHSGGYSTEYFHLSRITTGIRPGMKVSRGQVIGAVGMTGLATGPHLHFGLFKNNNYIDPLSSKLPTILSEKDLRPPSYIQATLRILKEEHANFMVAANTNIETNNRG